MDWGVPEGWDWAVSGLGGQVGAWALVLARVLGLCLTAPGLAVPGLSWRFRLGLAAMLGAVLAPVIGERLEAPADWAGVAWTGAGEVLTGAMLGMAAGLIVAGARAAGDLVAAQAGLSTTTLFDPESGEEVTPLGRLYGLVAMAAFLALGGPLALVRALAESYATFPLGGFVLSQRTAAFAFEPGGPRPRAGAAGRRGSGDRPDHGRDRAGLAEPNSPVAPVPGPGPADPGRPRHLIGRAGPRGLGDDPHGILGNAARTRLTKPRASTSDPDS